MTKETNNYYIILAIEMEGLSAGHVHFSWIRKKKKIGKEIRVIWEKNRRQKKELRSKILRKV